ncbi:MAG: hypothetical protein KDA84_13360 [Planctomycetaceae bacterium]|nr:hypothetical protein [Planctomycetaceae bacterium]
MVNLFDDPTIGLSAKQESMNANFSNSRTTVGMLLPRWRKCRQTYSAQ